MEKKIPAAANQPKFEAQSFREIMQALEAEPGVCLSSNSLHCELTRSN